MEAKSVRYRTFRRLGLVLGGLLAILLVAALLVLTFGWTYLRHPLETRLSAALGRPVTIARLHRIDHGFLNATVAVEGVHVAQPDWAGGDFVTIRQATVTLPVLPLLSGLVRPDTVTVDGLRIVLLRRDAAHANWKGLPGGKGGKGGGLGIRRLVVRNGQLLFRDNKRDHFFNAAVTADDAGLRIDGHGTLLGRPMTVRLAGPAPIGRAAWPFRLDYRSPIANVALDGRADRPLDIGHFSASVHAWGDDLKHLDQLIEAGLPGTAPVDLHATVRHDRPDWHVASLAATIGRSRVSGALNVLKQGDRTVLQGKITSDGLDFDDLANAEGRARAAAKRAASGNRRLPDTAINLRHLMNTDAAVDIDIRRLLFRSPSAFRSVKGTLTLDHGMLIAHPLTVALSSGVVAGSARITQKGSVPTLGLDLALAGARMDALLPGASGMSGPLRARILLQGPGATVRDAIGHATGRFAIVGANGTINRKVSLLLGQDAGRGLTADRDDRTRLRCLVGSFVVRDGRATPAPLLIDTDVAQASGRGMLDLRNERIDLSLTGNPKQKSILRLSGPIRVTGSLFSPQVAAPQATSRSGILASLGRIFGGHEAQPLAGDADCGALTARALR